MNNIGKQIHRILDSITSTFLFKILATISVLSILWTLRDFFISRIKIISAFTLPHWNKILLYLAVNIEVPRRIVALPYFLLGICVIYFLFKILLPYKRHKYILVKFKRDNIKHKVIVKFHLEKGGNKENAYGELICAICRIPYEHIHRTMEQDVYLCRRCTSNYNESGERHIIALARSKWIKELF